MKFKNLLQNHWAKFSQIGTMHSSLKGTQADEVRTIFQGEIKKIAKILSQNFKVLFP